MLELIHLSRTVFPKASVVLKETIVPPFMPPNQNVASCPVPSPIGCSKVFGPSYHWTQRAIVHRVSPATGTKAATLSDAPLNSLARPTFPGTSVVPVITPSLPCLERSFISPVLVRVSMSYARMGPSDGGGRGVRPAISDAFRTRL